MLHPNTELAYISDAIGYGVVATSLIKKGTITWVLDKLDREFKPDDVSKMDKLFQDILEKYSFTNNLGNLVLCWDHARFVNHSFKSNCLTTAYDFEIAIRDILPGEQLTDDYGYLNISEPFTAMDEGTERKIVYPDDLLKYHTTWDKLLKPAFKEILNTDQALKSLFNEDQWQNIRNVCEGKIPIESILNCYYDAKK